jgi:hypothetical protein
MKSGTAKNAGKNITSGSRFSQDDPAQYKRFLEAAHKAGADETEKGADRAFRKVAKPIGRPSTDRPRKADHNPK